MSRLLTASTSRFVLLLVLGAAGCRGERAAPSEFPAPAVDAAPPPGPATPFDDAPVVFDTVEPPDQVVQIPQRPDPPRQATQPPRDPPARPGPPLPPPAPPVGGPSGSCDVRATEGFCFAYTGTGWTPEEAEANCAVAPDATFDPGVCPLEDRIATCAFRRPSAPDREIVYTYYAPYDLVLAELACPGTFTRLE